MNDILVHNDLAWAEAGLLPIDSAIFGFPAGVLNLQAGRPSAGASASLLDWVESSGSVVTATSIQASELRALQVLQGMGFVAVDMALQATLMNIKRRPKTLQAGTVRPATPSDFAGIESIAATSFDFGRYHRDVRFPRELADRRFAVWVHDSLRVPKAGQQFFVMGEEGSPIAFMFAEVHEGRAQWHLGGVSRAASNGLLGPMLFAGVLDAMEAAGVRTVTAKISAANTPVLNIYGALGFHTGKPEFTLHFHHKSSPHLLPL